MFSGLITDISSCLKAEQKNSSIRLVLQKPPEWTNLKTGESIAVDGVCLSLVDFDQNSISFDLAPETLKITRWTSDKLKHKTFNLERSLSLQSALGGQILTGHVSGLAKVLFFKPEGESYFLKVQIPKKFKDFVIPKGYLALNGVSLTANQIKGHTISLCIIPETLKRSNLSQIKPGDLLNFELDYLPSSITYSLKKSFKNFLIALILIIPLAILLALSLWFLIQYL